MPGKSIFLAESENHVREALRLLLENQSDFVITGEADHAESMLAQVCGQLPDMILLDWDLPGFHPNRMIPTLQRHCPSIQIVAISVKPEHQKAAIEYGVDAFLLKQLDPDRFLAALYSVQQNEIKGTPS